MQISEFAEKTGVSAKTIRYYESIGLLPEAERANNGYRVYQDAEVNRLQLVAGARYLGFSLDEIREILDLRDLQIAPCNTLLDLLDSKSKEIEQRIEQLMQLKLELDELQKQGLTFARDDVEGKNCVCHLVSQKANP